LHTLLTVLLGFAAFLWVLQSLRAGFGIRRVPRLWENAPLADSLCPRVSIVFAARNEAPNLRAAVASMLNLDYPDYEVIAVDDRSDDESGAILDQLARNDSRLKVIHVTNLPSGWLGKPHALQLGGEAASGEWIVFTDADVRFAPDVVRRALALAESEHDDHLSLLAKLEMFGFWERVILTYFALGFLFGLEPWLTSDPKSNRYIGIGAFHMIRREVYEKIGRHTKLAMEVVEDLKLGKLVKLAGYRSQIAFVREEVVVRWHDGLRNIVRGTTKNFFAATGFQLRIACFHSFGLLLMSVFPWIAIFTVGGLPARAFAGTCIVCALVMHGGAARQTDCAWSYSLTHPIGALIYIWMLMRSTVLTLWRGGVIWRGTFYPLRELRKGIV
jgi:cellulose synthase/poly-beta-1,6-N-acetylglucosamine synthase-like glycosyltransferase